MVRGNILADIPSDLSQEVFEVLARSDSVRIERIVSSGHTSPETGWYDQSDNEWVIVLRGDAEIEFESGSIVHLEEGEYVNIPAHEKHRVTRTSSNPETVWLAIHYR